MIFGTLGADPVPRPLGEYLCEWGLGALDRDVSLAEGPGFRVGVLSTGPPVLDRGLTTYRDPDTGVAVAMQGEVFNRQELAERLGQACDTPLDRLLVEGFCRNGSSFFRDLNGSFVVVVCDPKRGRFVVARDHLGIEPLYYVVESGCVVHFSSSLRHLRAFAAADSGLDPTVLIRYLLLKHNPGFDTVFQGIRKLRPGHILEAKEGGIQEEVYWRLSFRDPSDRPEAEHTEALSELIRSAVRVRLGPGDGRAGAYLSGGMDSSSVVSVMGSALSEPVHTFSFRCEGESFDESRYARAVSRHWGTEHHEVPFEAEAATRIAELVCFQQEPLSDVGIEVASFILAREAQGIVDYVQTGDGGDELFAGHPVYMADRVARWYGRIPSLVRRPLGSALQMLPDRRQKKSILIKAKRFAYSFDFPADLHSNRWRIYYKPGELERLLDPAWRSVLEDVEPLRPLRTVYAEADGRDFLSRSLYGDYVTEVDFYLRRMEVLRGLGLAARFPLLDRRLVEYAATIPSNLKITSDSATKHLLHAAMSDLVPEQVLNRRDKLGNSVPLKNWLRESPKLQEFVRDILSRDAVRRRGILDPAYVERLWNRHLSRRENNSHRIWSLLVLELWCQHNLDGKGVRPEPRPAVP